MAYLSLYRKYRSQSFEELSGQDHVTRTLQNAIRSGKVAHAYLFCGPRGTGKTSSARLLAKALNCEKGPAPEPCNVCEACQAISAGTYLDLHEIDAASNRRIEDMRDLRDKVAYATVQGRFKVYVIDEAHQLTDDAFNALLKTLEEPPAHVIFVLATTEAFKIPATIISRCQKFEFRRASTELLRERVAYVAGQEGAQIDAAALDLIARSANGGWRDALSVLEQVLAFTEGQVTAKEVYAVLGTVEADTLLKLGDQILSADGAAVFDLVETLIAEGKDPRQLIGDLTEHFRTLMLAAAGRAPAGDAAQVKPLTEQAHSYGQARLIEAIEVLAHTDREARWSEQPRLLLELAATRLMHPRSLAAPVAYQEQPAATSRPIAERPTAPVARTTSAPASPPITPREETPLPPPVQANGTREPFVAEAPQAFGEGELPPPPLTVGDARTGHGDDSDDFGDLFGDAPPEVDSAPPSERATARPTSPPTAPTTPAFAPTAPPLRPTSAQPVASESSGSDLSGSLPLIQAKWKLIREELRRMKKATIGAVLADTLPSRFEGDQLVIQFPNRTLSEMFISKAKENGDAVSAAILRITNITCRVRAEFQGAAPAVGAAAGAAPSTPPSAPATSTRTAPRTSEPARSVAPTPPVASKPTSTSSAPKASQAPSASASGELVHDVLEVFDGRLVDDHDLA